MLPKVRVPPVPPQRQRAAVAVGWTERSNRRAGSRGWKLSAENDDCAERAETDAVAVGEQTMWVHRTLVKLAVCAVPVLGIAGQFPVVAAPATAPSQKPPPSQVLEETPPSYVPPADPAPPPPGASHEMAPIGPPCTTPLCGACTPAPTRCGCMQSRPACCGEPCRLRIFSRLLACIRSSANSSSACCCDGSTSETCCQASPCSCQQR